MCIYMVVYFDVEKFEIVLDMVIYVDGGKIGLVLVWVISIKFGDIIMFVGFGFSKGLSE